MEKTDVSTALRQGWVMIDDGLKQALTRNSECRFSIDVVRLW